MTSENCLWVQKALGMHGATCLLPTQWELEFMVPEGWPHLHPYSLPRWSRCVSLGSLGNGDQQDTFLGCFKFLF